MDPGFTPCGYIANLLNRQPFNFNCTLRPRTENCFMPEAPEVLTEYEVAELLRVQVSVVRRLRKQGRPPPFVMVGNHPRYPRSAIFAFLTAIESAPRQEAG